MSVWVVSILLLLILVNAFYVAAEFAIVGARATRIELLATQGHRMAAAVLPVLRDNAQLDRYIAACQIGITVSSLVLGAFGQATVALGIGALLDANTGLEPLGAYALAATLTLVALTSIQVVFGELIPKTVALQYPVGTTLATYRPMRWSLVAMAPFIDLLNGSGGLILRRLGVDVQASHRHIHAPEEIDLLIRESREGGVLADRDSERLREALQLGRHRIREVMVPRRQIAGLDLAAPHERLLAEVETAPYTRLVVHRGGLDDVRGYLHVKDLAVAIATGEGPSGLEALVRPLLVLPSALTIDRALGELRARRARIALLVDEYGDVEGLVSLEDILRELLGGLSDEFKSTMEMRPTQLADGRWRLPGRLPRDDLAAWAQALGAAPLAAATRAETLAGWLLEELDAIPAGRCCLIAAGFLFEIERLEGAAIEAVLATRLPAAQEAPHG
jgi:CBS domain containing-hemolysin-like protein